MAWISIIPALITIILTFKTKKLIPSLFAGVFIGGLLSEGSLWNGIAAIGRYIVDAVASKESAYTLAFLIAFGSLAELIEMAGGIAGFSERVEKWVKSERGLLGWAWILSLFTFFDSSFHTIAVGTILKPLLEKIKGSREKFAFILSVTSLQIILLIPIATGYLGYTVTLVSNNIKDKGIGESAYLIVAKSIIWNFFSWSMILIAILISVLGLGFGRFEIGKTGEDKEFTEGHLAKEEAAQIAIEEYPKRSRNLLIPVAILLLSTIFFFWWTGKDKGSTFLEALSQADYSASIFAGVLFTLFISSLYFMLQKISLAEIEAHIIKGGEKVLSLVIVLVLSWALTMVTEALRFNELFTPNTIQFIPKFLIPTVLFLLCGIIAYTIGSSWATWALMMPLAVNFSLSAGFPIQLMVGIVWAGGAVADIISPLSAQMADTPFSNHLVTSFPYLLLGVFLSSLGYLAIGLLW